MMMNEQTTGGGATVLEEVTRCSGASDTNDHRADARTDGQGEPTRHVASQGRAGDAIREFAARVLRGETSPPPIARSLGFTLVSLAPGHAAVEYAVDLERHANPMGTLHGGVLCDLADLAMGVAYGGTLQDDESFTTVELTINFLRPVLGGTLTAKGRVVHAGRSLGLVECDVTDERGRLVARAKSTCMTLRGAQAAGR